MKGVYIGTSAAKSPLLEPESGTGLVASTFQLGKHQVTTCHHSEVEPQRFGDNNLVVFCGWAYNGSLLDATSFYELYKTDQLCQIQSGNFIALIYAEREQSLAVVNDPFGLSTHFYRFDNGKLELAPTTSAFLDKKHDPVWYGFEQQHGHLVGEYTRYQGILRLPPASQIERDGNIHRYWTINSGPSQPLTEVRLEFAKQVEAWPLQARTIPLSSGFDSRLIASTAKFQFGYTYGVPNGVERDIAANIAENCQDYFQFVEPEKDHIGKNINQYLFDGAMLNLVATYRQAKALLQQKQTFAGDLAIFDGHLGDGLQRGSYLKLGGLLGAIFLLFPLLYKLPISARFLLKRRYHKLSDSNFKLLLDEFAKYTSGMALDDYQKIVYFEALYGRGGRYIVNGGNTSAGQYFTVVAPFANTKVFNILIHQDFSDVVAYRNLAALWHGAADIFLHTPTESGIRPVSPPLIAPFLRVFNALKQKLSNVFRNS